jgi:hypothetical protein
MSIQTATNGLIKRLTQMAGKTNFFRRLVENNSGVSSKSFFLVVVTIIGFILLLVPAITLIVEIIFTHTIATDLTGMAAYITAVGSLFLSAGITKAWSEKFENHGHGKGGESEEDE